MTIPTTRARAEGAIEALRAAAEEVRIGVAVSNIPVEARPAVTAWLRRQAEQRLDRARKAAGGEPAVSSAGQAPARVPHGEGPEYTPCGCGHIEPEHEPDAGECYSCDCPAYAPAGPARQALATDQTRDRIAEAALAAVETALGDTLVPDAREEALAGIAAVLPAPADQTAPAMWVDGHPLLEAIAAAVWEQCGRSDSGACVEDDPRNIAVAALSAMTTPASRGCTAHIENAHTHGRQHCTRPAGHTSSHASPLIADEGCSGEAGRIYWDDRNVGAVLPTLADRAAVLRWAADRIDATRADFPIAVQNGITWATAEMRRHAADEQPGARHVHITIHHPDPTTAITAAHAIADLIRGEYSDSLRLAITTDAQDTGAAPHRPADETPDTTTARGCPPDCPCRAVCIGTLKPATGARQDGAAS
ncbi:hypothetical protein [Streptomyces sp. bgisy022]|uniref:hypothetical protein n=1 Tax=Streptomyces sp. bgisy022 TaxID=3413769 RepID=UPI003D74A73C